MKGFRSFLLLLAACHSPSSPASNDAAATIPSGHAVAAPSPSPDPTDALFAGDPHFRFVGPIASLEVLCQEVNAAYQKHTGALPAKACSLGARRTLSAGRALLEIALYTPAEALPDVRDAGPRIELIALRTSKGWFAEQRSPHALPRPASMPLEKARETGKGVVFLVHEEQPPTSISEDSPPKIVGAGRMIDKSVHCRSDAEGAPECTARLPAR